MILRQILMAAISAFFALPITAATTWYVNGTSGSDSYTGTSESSAKATIQAAIDLAIDGDTILVAPGAYAPISTENKEIAIRSTSGAASTIIDGGNVRRCVTVLPRAHRGPLSAVVCTNTCVYGFTLQNGNSGEERHADEVVNFGGGVIGGTYYNCRILNNRAGGGGGCEGAILHNCLLKGNYAINGGATEASVCYNCTITENSVRDSGVAGWDSAFLNCIVYGNANNWSIYYNNSDQGPGAPAYDLNYCRENVCEIDPNFVDATNGDYRLAAGSSCIDAGDNSYVASDMDLAGNARVANGIVDIGCYEYGSLPVHTPVWKDENNWYKSNYDGENWNYGVTLKESVLHLEERDSGARLFLSVYGAGVLSIRARGSSDGFWVGYDNGSYSEGHIQYVRADSFQDYVIDISGDGLHTILWTTYPESWAWGEIASVSWNGVSVPLDGAVLPSLADGLVAYYPFAGNANDASGNGNHLSNAGNATLTIGHDGISNGAYYFDGSTNSKLQIDPRLVVSTNFSYALWFKTSVAMSSHGASSTAWNPGNDIIHSGFADYGYVGVGLRVGTDGLAVVEHGGMYRHTVFSYSHNLSSYWHHIVVTVSNNNAEVVYLDGQQVGTAETDADSLTAYHGNGTKALHLEGDGVGGGTWGLYTGSIDDLYIYNRALSAAEVKALYDETAVTPVPPPTYKFMVGLKDEVDVGLVGYKVTGLPNGLKYDAKKGTVSGTAKKAGEYEVTFTKEDEADVTAIFIVHDEEVSVGCEGLSGGTFTAGVAGSADGIPLEIESETGVKSVSVTKLPAGMKYDTKAGRITGAPTKAGDYNVVVTVTTKSGAKRTETIAISVAALPDNAVGTFNGFVKADDGVENIGTFQLTTTDAGKLTAKVITADGTYSFSGTCWDAVEDDTYSVTLATKKGETLVLELDASAGWDENQLTGAFSAAGTRDACPYQIVARRNAFGKTWYFAADGGIESGWTLSYAANSKAANLTVTLNADGSLKLAGKLGTLSVTASGYADVTGIANGVIFADFAPVVLLKEGKTTIKKVLSIRSNLWFDRSNDHAEGVGSALLLR